MLQNRNTPTVMDSREQHRTYPPTKWFISSTDTGRRLKIVFVVYDGDVVIKTAFQATNQIETIYTEILGKQREKKE